MRNLLMGVMLWLGLVSGALAEDVLGGGYFGIGNADGMRLVISQDAGGFSGTLSDASGTSQPFSADAVGDSAETVVDLNGRPAFLRISPVPVGATVAWTPIDPTGVMLAAETQVLAFLKDGTALPDLPEEFVPPPSRPGALISGNAFLMSYSFWPPDGVVTGYEALPQKFRTLMRMFPLVQLDVIWKLCLAPDAGQAQAVALRGQGLTCDQVNAQFAAMQRDGRFDRFKDDADAERGRFVVTVRCADAYPMTKQQCDEAARYLATAAVSMETAATALSRYR